MSDRPRLDIPLTTHERTLEAVAFLLLVIPLLYTGAVWSDLPDTVPMHFRFDGSPDGWGSKYSIFWLIGVAWLVYAGLTLLARFPHVYNYPWAITETNAERQYTLARTLVRWIKLEVAAVFGYILWGIVVSAREGTLAFSGVTLALLLAAISATVIIYMIRAGKAQ